MEQRHPHLILGVDADCEPEEASVAFARKARRVRRDPDPLFGTEELTWALHQIEQAADDPANKELLDFRVPADPDVYPDEMPPNLNQPPLKRQHPRDQEAIARLEWEALATMAERQLRSAAGYLSQPAPQGLGAAKAKEPHLSVDIPGTLGRLVSNGTVVAAAVLVVVVLAAVAVATLL